MGFVYGSRGVLRLDEGKLSLTRVRNVIEENVSASLYDLYGRAKLRQNVNSSPFNSIAHTLIIADFWLSGARKA